MVGAAVALLLALSWGGSRYGWASVQIMGLVGVSALMWALFVWRLMTAPEPFIPLTMVREPVVGAVVVAGFFGIGTIIGLGIAGYGLFTAKGTVTRVVPPENVALVNQRPILRTDFIAQTEDRKSVV